MKRYIQYFKYVMKHKYYVMIECFKEGLYWRGIVHDLDKFLPSSLTPYAKTFYNPDGSKRQIRDKTGYYVPTAESDEFKEAWLRHTRVNKHHWQYWVLATEEGEEIYQMDMSSVIEMICDWKGAGRAQGTPDTLKWWKANKKKMRLDPKAVRQIEFYLKLK